MKNLFLEEDRLKMEQEYLTDSLRKKREDYIKKLENLSFPVKELKENSYDINYLIDVLITINEISPDSSKQNIKLIKKDISDNEIGNYRKLNLFHMINTLSDEKDYSNFFLVLLEEYNKALYKDSIRISERGNFYIIDSNKKSKIKKDFFFILVEKVDNFLELFHSEIIKRAESIFGISPENSVAYNELRDKKHQISKLLTIKKSLEKKDILKYFITFMYIKWQYELLNNMKELYKKNYENLTKKIESLNYSEINIKTIGELTRFLNRNKESKRDTLIEEKLKKLHLFTAGAIKDYTDIRNYPIEKEELKKLDNFFKNIYLTNEKLEDKKLSYYLEVYRENLYIIDAYKFLSILSEKLPIIVMCENLGISLENTQYNITINEILEAETRYGKLHFTIKNFFKSPVQLSLKNIYNILLHWFEIGFTSKELKNMEYNICNLNDDLNNLSNKRTETKFSPIIALIYHILQQVEKKDLEIIVKKLEEYINKNTGIPREIFENYQGLIFMINDFKEVTLIKIILLQIILEEVIRITNDVILSPNFETIAYKEVLLERRIDIQLQLKFLDTDLQKSFSKDILKIFEELEE